MAAMPHPNATAGSIHHASGICLIMIVLIKRAVDNIVPIKEHMPSLWRDALLSATEYWNLITVMDPKMKMEAMEIPRSTLNDSASSIPLRKSLTAWVVMKIPKINKMTEMATDARFSRCFSMTSTSAYGSGA